MKQTVPLPSDDVLSQETVDYLKKLPSLNVFRMMSHLPASLPPFIELAKSLLESKRLTPRAREIAILRVAYLTRSAYEWHQHVLLGKANGITDTEIEIIQTESPVRSLNEAENFICQIADELTLEVNLQEDTFNKLFTQYSYDQGCELILLVGFYNMLSRYLNATRTPIEETNPLEGRTRPT